MFETHFFSKHAVHFPPCFPGSWQGCELGGFPSKYAPDCIRCRWQTSQIVEDEWWAEKWLLYNVLAFFRWLRLQMTTSLTRKFVNCLISRFQGLGGRHLPRALQQRVLCSLSSSAGTYDEWVTSCLSSVIVQVRVVFRKTVCDQLFV